MSGEIRIKMGFVTELDPEMRGILESFAEKMTIKAQVVSTDDLAE